MPGRVRPTPVAIAALLMLACVSAARGEAEVRLDRDFLAGLVEKLPPTPFQKAGQYHGAARAFRLVGIDAKGRRFVVACEVGGEFRPPVAVVLRPERKGSSTTNASANAPPASDTPGWKSFTFDVTAAVRVEPGADGTPRFSVDVEEVKRRDLEGVAGVVAKVLGKLFNDIVTKVADGKAEAMSAKLNAKLLKQMEKFKEYGVFRAIDYTADGVVLHFDVTRYKSEGIAGYVFAEATPGTVPLYRFVRPRFGDHFYTTDSLPQGLPGYVYEGVACHVFRTAQPKSTPLERWQKPRERLYTTPTDPLPLTRQGYRFETIACHVYTDAKPGAVPFYRFVDPRTGVHFYTTHPHAEFMK